MTNQRMAIVSAVLTEPLSEHSQLITDCMYSWFERSSQRGLQYESRVRYNIPSDNLGVTGSLQWLYEHTTAPIIAFLHSDLEIMEKGWDERVLAEFDDPQVGVVGFGGAKQHGLDDIYKVPYRLEQLARVGYLSNTIDAEVHGTRFMGARDVAVLDGFCLVVRRALLDRMGGWPVKDCPFHSYDYWCAIAAHKLGYRVRLVGVSCTHHGGATSTTRDYQEWSERVLGKTDAQVHEESHRFIYNYGRGYLPWRCA